MAYGFITDGFISAFNPNRTTLSINNTDLGVPVDGYSITPNDSYVIQPTGFGTLKTVWSHLSLSGDIVLYLKDVPEDTANLIDKICLKQDTNYYVAFLGYLYRTEQVDVTIQPSSGSINKLDVTLNFYGKLPYSTPIFRPGFSGSLSSEITRISGITPTSVCIVPLPGNTLSNKEDTLLTLCRNDQGYTLAKVFSSVKDYASATLSIDISITSNYEASTTAVGLLNLTEGLDELVFAQLNAGTIKLKFYKVKDNVISSLRSDITLTELSATRLQITEGRLYVYKDAAGSYSLVSYNLLDKAISSTRKVLEDSTLIRSLSVIPEAGQQAPLAPPITSNGYGYVLHDNKTKLLIVNTAQDAPNAYDSFILPRSTLRQIPGVTETAISSMVIEQVRKISPSKIIVFFRNLAAGNGYVHYAIINFRDRDNARGNWTGCFVTTYRIANVNLGAFNQTYTYLGISQTNTAVFTNNKCYMSTEAYTDFYVEDNVLAMTQTTTGFKFIVKQEGTDVVIKCMSK